jgi:hypothetical protein
MSTPAGVLAMAVLAGVTVAGQSAPALSKPPNTSPKAVAALASRYLEEYTAKLALAVAEETYIQETYASANVRTGSRLLKGEIYITFLPKDRIWMAVHDVFEVDGEPVPDRKSVVDTVLRGNLTTVAADIARQNSRYNLGRITRTFNEPTLALLVVDKSHVNNFEFKSQSVETSGAVTLVTLSFIEKRRPTIVSSTSHAPIYSRGEMVVDAATGHVRATRLMLKDGHVTAEVATTYMLEPKLKLWVPSVYTERYEGEPEGLKEINTGRAVYTNYRQHESFGRIRGGGGR